MKQLNHQTIIKCEQIIRSSQALTDFVMVSEKYRKKFSDKLRESLAINDITNNQIIELKQNKRLTEISYHLVETKLSMVFESITQITDTKKLEDKFQFEIDNLNEKLRVLQTEHMEDNRSLEVIIKERD